MFHCNRNLSPLQRRALQQVGGMIACTAAFTILFRPEMRAAHLSPVEAALLSVLFALPVIAAIAVIARYLRAEPDEFVRALITRALLWGMGVTMAVDAVVGVLFELYGTTVPLAILNADLFFISAGLSFRLLQRSYR